jgi:hypothetical protein
MMPPADWTSYDPTRINVVLWPGAEPIGNGQARSTWSLEFFDDVTDECVQKLGRQLNELASKMSFAVERVGPCTVAMSCTFDVSMPEPVRFGAASLAWRFLDERIARLWLIGGQPRALYPEFKRQRRQLIQELSPAHRRFWLWLAMVRSEPLFAAVAARHSTALGLLSGLRDPGGERAVASEYRRLSEQLPVSPGAESPVAGNLGLDDLRWVLGQAASAAFSGARDDSVDLMAYATERVFEALLVLDRATGTVSSHGLAGTEDTAWFDDYEQLRDTGDLDQILHRSGTVVQRLVEFREKKGLP